MYGSDPGNRSESTAITVTVLKRENNLSYTDMEGHPGHVAALAMSYCGAMSGSVIGGEAVFAPDAPINCAEFVAALQTAMDIDMTEAEGVSLPSALPSHLAPFVKTALANGWLNEDRATEESLLTSLERGKAAEIICLAMQMELDPIPGVDRAEQSLALLAKYGILPLCDGAICPEKPLTRAEAAMTIMALLDRM